MRDDPDDVAHRDGPPRTSPSYVEEVRQRTVAAASDMMRGPNRSSVDRYLALLQDRLPVYVRSLSELAECVGQASVRENLRPAAHAAIDFYSDILGAKASLFVEPAQLARLREVMRSRKLGGPHAAQNAIADYIRLEQHAGRVAVDVEPAGVAALLLGACVNYVFTAALMGADHVLPKDDYVGQVLGGLRLEG